MPGPPCRKIAAGPDPRRVAKISPPGTATVSFSYPIHPSANPSTGRTIAEMWEHQRVDDRTDQLPQGTVTFLFTDIEGSTRIAEALADTWPKVLATHHDLLRREAARAGGVVVSTEGDAFFVAFDQATDAIRGAIEMQRAIAAQAWPDGTDIRVRMGLHTGDAVARWRQLRRPRRQPGGPDRRGGARRPDPHLGGDAPADRGRSRARDPVPRPR